MPSIDHTPNRVRAFHSWPGTGTWPGDLEEAMCSTISRTRGRFPDCCCDPRNSFQKPMIWFGTSRELSHNNENIYVHQGWKSRVREYSSGILRRGGLDVKVCESGAFITSAIVLPWTQLDRRVHSILLPWHKFQFTSHATFHFTLPLFHAIGLMNLPVRELITQSVNELFSFAIQKQQFSRTKANQLSDRRNTQCWLVECHSFDEIWKVVTFIEPYTWYWN